VAQKRMIDKKISVSEQVADLSLEAKLIFTWSIPHTDDFGLLPHSSRTLKAMIVPMEDISMEDFGFHLETIVKAGLFDLFEYKGLKYFRVTKFDEHQTLKRDRKPVTLLPDIDSWSALATLGFQMEDIGNPREEKGRETKGREEKKSEIEKETPKEKTDIVKFTQKDMELAELLVSLIKQNNPAWQLRGNMDAWAENIEKLNRIDERTYEQIEVMIRWTQADSFWSQNILSTAKLRDKFNDLIPRLKKVKSGRAGTVVNR